MTRRRLSQLFLLLALMLAPLGRLEIAQAMTTAHRAPMAMAHCGAQPATDRGKDHRMAVDCMIACAAMAPLPTALALVPPVAEALPPVPPAAILAGIRPEADPPPPRPA